MRKYEVIFIVKPMEEEATSAVVEKFTKLIADNGGTVDSEDRWGKKRLAYPINDETEGVYTVIRFTSNPDFPAELDRVFKITEGVLRSMTIAVEE